MRRLPRLVVLALVFAPAAIARAHDFWLEPGSFQPAPGEAIGVRLRVGEALAGDPLPRRARQVVRFDAVSDSDAAASSPLSGADGAEPAGHWVPGSEGFFTLVYVSSGARVELDPERFAGYLAEEGLDRALAAWRRSGETDAPARDRYTRHAKALVAVGEPAASERAFTRPLGLELELVPERNPLALHPGAALAVRVLWRGKPLAGAQVVSRSRARPDSPELARTDRSGRATFHLDEAGMWMIKAVHMVRAEADPLADWHSAWASLTFSLRER